MMRPANQNENFIDYEEHAIRHVLAMRKALDIMHIAHDEAILTDDEFQAIAAALSRPAPVAPLRKPINDSFIKC